MSGERLVWRDNLRITPSPHGLGVFFWISDAEDVRGVFAEDHL